MITMNDTGFYYIRSAPIRGMEWFLLLVSLTLVLAGCTGTRDAYKSADTLNETAYVVAEHYDITLAQIDAYVHRPDADPALKARLQDAVREGQDVILELKHASETYGELRTAETEEQLSIALNKALVQLNKLLTAIKGIR